MKGMIAGLCLAALAAGGCTERVAPTDILEAVAAGRADAVRRLAAEQPEQVARRGRHGDTPLTLAAEKGDVRMGELLLELGADLNGTDSEDRTPLHLAAMFGRAAFAKMLISRGATVDAGAGAGGTPLQYAAANGQAEVARTLLDAGADPDAKNSGGQTALRMLTEGPFCLGVSKEGVEACKKLLVARGATVPAPRAPEAGAPDTSAP